MSRSWRPALSLLACTLALAAGCSRGLASTSSLPNVPNLDLPEVVPPRPKMSPEIATMVYPDADKKLRDPFLTVLEQSIADDRKDMEGLVKPVALAVLAVPGKRAPGLPFQRVIKQLHEEVHSIFLGAPNVFVFKGRPYEEGDVIDGTDWVVLSIQETGIKLRSKDGTGSDYLQFKTAPSINFEFTSDKPKDDASGGHR